MPIKTKLTTPKGALICALMAPSRDLLGEATQILTTHFGPVRHASQTYAFDYTDYFITPTRWGPIW